MKERETVVADVQESKVVITPKEVASYLRLPLSTVYKLTREGTLPGVKFGKHWRYVKAEIDSYLTGLSNE
jgi:excisionase family DNA binding protein